MSDDYIIQIIYLFVGLLACLFLDWRYGGPVSTGEISDSDIYLVPVGIITMTLWPFMLPTIIFYAEQPFNGWGGLIKTIFTVGDFNLWWLIMCWPFMGKARKQKWIENYLKELDRRIEETESFPRK